MDATIITSPTTIVKPDDLATLVDQLAPPYRRIYDAVTAWQIDLTYGDRTTPMAFDQKRLAKACLLVQTNAITAHEAGHFTVASSNPRKPPYTITQTNRRNRGQPVCPCPDYCRTEEHNFIGSVPGPIFCKHTIAVLIATGQWDSQIKRYAPPEPEPEYDYHDEWQWADLHDECLYHLMTGHYTERS